MIEDKSIGLKIAENPKEALLHTAAANSEKRLLEMEFAIEIEKYVLEYLKKKIKNKK